MEEFIEYLKTEIKCVKETTVQNYIDAFKFITKGCNSTNFLKVFDDINEIKIRIEKSKSINTRAQHLSSIKKICQYYKLQKLMSDETKKDFDLYCKKTYNDKTVKNDQQEHTILYTYDDFIKVFNLYEENSIEYLFMAVNMFIPPRRKDWEHAIFVESMPEDPDKNTNYVVIGDDGPVSLIFNKFKNEKYMGSWKKLLDDDDFKYLRFFPTFNPNDLSQLLQSSFYDNPRNEVFDYQKVLKTINKNKYNVHVTQNGLRHAFSHYVFKNKSISQHYLKEIYNDMGGKNLDCFRRYDSILEVKNFINDDDINETESLNSNNDSDIISICETDNNIIEINDKSIKNNEPENKYIKYIDERVPYLQSKILEMQKEIDILILTKEGILKIETLI